MFDFWFLMYASLVTVVDFSYVLRSKNVGILHEMNFEKIIIFRRDIRSAPLSPIPDADETNHI